MPNGKICMSAEVKKDVKRKEGVHSIFSCSSLRLLALVRGEDMCHYGPLVLYDSARDSELF